MQGMFRLTPIMYTVFSRQRFAQLGGFCLSFVMSFCVAPVCEC